MITHRSLRLFLWRLVVLVRREIWRKRFLLYWFGRSRDSERSKKCFRRIHGTSSTFTWLWSPGVIISCKTRRAISPAAKNWSSSTSCFHYFVQLCFTLFILLTLNWRPLDFNFRGLERNRVVYIILFIYLALFWLLRSQSFSAFWNVFIL